MSRGRYADLARCARLITLDTNYPWARFLQKQDRAKQRKTQNLTPLTRHQLKNLTDTKFWARSVGLFSRTRVRRIPGWIPPTLRRAESINTRLSKAKYPCASAINAVFILHYLQLYIRPQAHRFARSFRDNRLKFGRNSDGLHGEILNRYKYCLTTRLSTSNCGASVR